MPFFYKAWERKTNGSNVAIVVNYGVASFLSWSKSIRNPQTCIPRIKIQRWNLKTAIDKLANIYLPLKGKPLGSHMVDWKYTPTVIGWTKNQVLGR